MGCNGGACAECTQNCLFIHRQKKNPPSTITSFFKIMFGDNFSNFLFLPPKFARTVTALVGQKTHLEDSSGQQWKVTLSVLNGSIAFRQGWHAFSVDHGLEIGDFLVFSYIKGSHFVVQIYGKNGCQKLDFSEGNGGCKKRKRIDGDLIAKNGPAGAIDKGSVGKWDSSTSAASGSDIEISQSQCHVNYVETVPVAAEKTSNLDNGSQRLKTRTENIEEPYCIIDRDPGYKQVEDRIYRCDLSNFEMPMSNLGVDSTKKFLVKDERSPPADTSQQSQTKAGIVDKCAVAEAVWVADSDAMIGDKQNSEKKDKTTLVSGKDLVNSSPSGHLWSTSSVNPARNGNNRTDVLNLSITENQKDQQRSGTRSCHDMVSQKKTTPLMESSRGARWKISRLSDSCSFPVSTAMRKYQSADDRLKVLKKEKVEMIEDTCGYAETICGDPQIINECNQSSNPAMKEDDKIYKVVKTEPVDSTDFPSLVAINLSCSVVVASQSFLELPTNLPATSSKGRTRKERKLILLRDPVSRLWPVIYQEKYGFKVLTSGWDAFVKTNNIQAGDQCVFGVENELECIYRVSIIQK